MTKISLQNSSKKTPDETSNLPEKKSHSKNIQWTLLNPGSSPKSKDSIENKEYCRRAD